MPYTRKLCLNRKRSVLFFSPCTPDAAGTGWEQRCYAQILGYGGFMHVDVWFMPTVDNPDLARLAAMAPHVRSITAFYPCAFDDPNLGLQRRLMDQLAAADVVHVCRLPQLALNIAHKCVIWDIDELPWSPNRPAAAGPLVTRGAAAPVDPLYARGAAKVRVVMASSSRERPPGAKQFVVLPVAVPIPDAAAVRSDARDASLLFVGNLNYLPNVDALVHLQEAVLPALVELLPDVRITIVGRAPVTNDARAAIDRLRRVPQFDFVFDAPDCAPYYRGCSIAIAPIRLGGGTRVKILEAFAQRVPVVSTTKGCEGLAVSHGEHLLIADEPEAFARCCVEAMRDPTLRARITAGGLAYVEAHHAQPVVDRVLADTVAGLFPA
jgi:glycosyltransferase involved in cell wall biosynthesis